MGTRVFDIGFPVAKLHGEDKSMIIGVPKEMKRDEYRVGLLPVGVEELTRAGHRVLVESGAGLGSGLTDQEYAQARGGNGRHARASLFGRADMIIKVKEPQPGEIAMLRRGQIVFTYFHLAADRQLTEALLASGCIAVAYETLERRARPAAAADADERSGRAA